MLQDIKTNEGERATWNQMGVIFPPIHGADIVGKVVELGEGVTLEILTIAEELNQKLIL